MKIDELILEFYQHLLSTDNDNRNNWTLHKNGMCNSNSRNPDECLSLWIIVKKNFVEVVALIEAKTDDINEQCANSLISYMNENNINGLVRMDSTVDNVKFRSKRRSRFITSKQWLESPIECFDWAIDEYYKYVKLFNKI